jgi:hypothetical protein
MAFHLWRYHRRGERAIHAPVEAVYRIVADPVRAPEFAREISCLEPVRELGPDLTLMRCHMRAVGIPCTLLLRYRRRVPHAYGGRQQGRPLLGGFFSFRLRPSRNGTLVTHTEGLTSRLPGLAWLAGVVYYGLLARGKIERELARLSRLAETETAPTHETSRNSA